MYLLLSLVAVMALYSISIGIIDSKRIDLPWKIAVVGGFGFASINFLILTFTVDNFLSSLAMAVAVVWMLIPGMFAGILLAFHLEPAAQS